MLNNHKKNKKHTNSMTKTKTTHKFNCKLGQVGRSLGCCGLGVGVSENGGAAGHLPSEVARGDAPIELDCQVLHVRVLSDLL